MSQIPKYPNTQIPNTRERLAVEIIQASPLMPDPAAHRHWLETQPVRTLQERLKIIVAQSRRRDGRDGSDQKVRSAECGVRNDLLEAAGV